MTLILLAADSKKKFSLWDSIKQLKHYLDGDAGSERIIVQKSDKVELIRKKIYAEKSAITLDKEDWAVHCWWLDIENRNLS